MNIIIGNAISFVGSLFLWASCVAKTKKRVLLIQFVQCAILTVAQIVFGKGAGAVSMSVAGIRNVVIATGHYGFPVMLLTAFTTLILGLYFNTGGLIGLMPVAAGIFYTVALYFAKDVKKLKLSLSVLLSTWVVYSVLIFDIFGTISNASALVLNIITLAKLRSQDDKYTEKVN